MADDTDPAPVPLNLDDPLFAPTRLPAEVCKRDPLIVVGLPRSGSSFLSHILSQVPDWYVFDDLYTQRQAGRLRVKTPMVAKDLGGMMFYLGWQIRARLRFGLYAIPNVTEDEVPAMDAALIQAFTDRPGTWAELQEEWMRRLATRAGCARWGYKMPGAFRQIPQLRDHYPQARFMFIMRNPYKVLASYKHMPATSQDGNPRRYHPIAYAIYWRMAVRAYLAYRDTLGDRLTLVQFEDLVGQPQQTATRIADFLGATPPQNVHVPEKPNTSFDAGGKKVSRDLTGLERWILNRVAHKEMAALGYDMQPARVRPGDFWDILRVTVRFAGFYLQRLVGRGGTR